LSRLPFRAGVFASAVSNSTLEHVEDLEAVIAEVARVVRPGGLFHFTVPTPAKRALLHFSEFARQHDLPRLADRYDQAFDDFWGHRNYLTVTEWSSLLAGHGFELSNVQFYESAEASRLADLLSTVSVTTRSFDDAELDQLVQHAWREAWWDHLGGHLDPVAPGVGTSICCSARRQLA
jgi:SAM-dependent methyltransferase